jgi:26S proteasome regulatory subunit N5
VEDLLQRTLVIPQLDDAAMVTSKQLLTLFTTHELIAWPLADESTHKLSLVFAGGIDASILAAEVAVAAAGDAMDVVVEDKKVAVKADDAATLEKRWQDFHKRTVQHNIRVIARYYSQIESSRLAALLQLDGEKTEAFLSEMVTDKQLVAKIDRPAGVVSFVQKQSPEQVLNVWRSDIGELLSLVESTCHLINKDNITYGVKV